MAACPDEACAEEEGEDSGCRGMPDAFVAVAWGAMESAGAGCVAWREDEGGLAASSIPGAVVPIRKPVCSGAGRSGSAGAFTEAASPAFLRSGECAVALEGMVKVCRRCRGGSWMKAPI